MHYNLKAGKLKAFWKSTVDLIMFQLNKLQFLEINNMNENDQINISFVEAIATIPFFYIFLA